VLAYGVGLALTLVLIGLLLVGSGRALVERLGGMRWFPARSRRLLPVGTATAVVLVGIGLVLRSLPAAIA
jgi:nickel/cobalt transporter (NicO) family protein